MNENELTQSRLEKAGWCKRFVASEPRLGEAVEMYQDIGFDVHLEPLSKYPSCDSCIGPEEGDDCRICYEGNEDLYWIIYTRAKEAV